MCALDRSKRGRISPYFDEISYDLITKRQLS
jgi:hypothetical protein